LFRVLFIEQKISMRTLTLSGLEASPLGGGQEGETELSINMADLILEMREEGEAVLVSFFYKMDLFEQTTIGRMLEYLQYLLEQFMSRPEQLISELPTP
jgi:non-ribosomal peptide synthetase component F